jgi:hypothetical protein
MRQQNRFVTPFGSGDGELPVEAGRYRLLWYGKPRKDEQGLRVFS